MINVVGVRFRTAGKIYYFAPGTFELVQGSHVIVETARGVEFGTVMIAPRELPEEKVIQPLKPVLRIATPEDEKTEEKNRQKEKEAFRICLEKIQKRGMEMKLVDAEYTFDNNKLLFYFTADGRIDFRELVKDLAAVFRTRIELRQIGVRDETKILGGIGICGRLMCCLKNEEETYEYLNSRLPSIGDYVTTFDRLRGEVQSVNVLRQTVKVIVEIDDEKEIREYKIDQIRFKPKRRKNHTKLSPEELKELSALEDKGKSKIDDAH